MQSDQKEDRYEHKICDAATLEFWQNSQIYKSTGRPCDEGVFSVDTPPPTVSGSLHVGHLFSYCHADFLVRYNRQIGKKVFYPMGFDDNGLPTEKFAIESRGLKLAELSRKEFVNICHEVSQEARIAFRDFWTKLGLSVDWDSAYSTISPQSVRASQTAFLNLYQKGLVERRAEPFLFCTTCQTSVAQAELEWREKEGAFHTIVFSVEQTGQPIKIATTRPELIEACVAIMVNPDNPKTADLIGKSVVVPISGKIVPVLADQAVSAEKGSGVVMCCTFGDQVDVAWFKKFGLPLVSIIGKNGRMEAGSKFAGQVVGQCRKNVLSELGELGLLEKSEKIVHGAHVHERCRNEVEFLVTNQWFVKIVQNRDLFLKLAQQIDWSPEHFKCRYDDWVSNLSWDWCISRQRFYGVPLPVFYCNDCGATVLPPQEKLPVWPTEDGSAIICQSCKGQNLTGETDVADTWFTSSISPLLISGWPDKEFIGSLELRPQAHDIIRTWAFYTIVNVYYQTGKLPWRSIAMSGHVLAAPGEKISKSKGNAKNSPPELVAEFGADALRYWACGGRLGVDTIFDQNAIKKGLRTQTKLYNAVKFAALHTDLSLAGFLEPKSLLARWLLAELFALEQRYHESFSSFDYTEARDSLEGFFWSVLCDNYLELSKDMFFNPIKYGELEVQENRQTLGFVLRQVVAMYGPVMPFIVEWLAKNYKMVGQLESIHNKVFQRTPVINFSQAEREQLKLMLAALELCRKAKSQAQVSQKTQILKCVVVCQQTLLQELKVLLSGCASIAELVWTEDENLLAEAGLVCQAEKVKVGLWF